MTGEPPDRRRPHATPSYHDTFDPQQLPLFPLVAGYQTARHVDDPPPWDVERRRRQNSADESRPLRITSDVGDVAVGRHLTRAEGEDHLDDSSFAIANDPILANPTTHWSEFLVVILAAS
jgi:hypothetical protein